MKKNLKRLILLISIFSIISNSVFASVILTKGQPSDYVDINDHWAYDSIKYVIMQGYFQGINSTEFSPDSEITRAMLVTALWRLTGDELTHVSYIDGVARVYPNYVKKFWDMKDSDWYTNYISWANSNKIITGYTEREFRPNENLTREQLSVILYNYMKEYRVVRGFTQYIVNDAVTFTDNDMISDWAKEKVSIMQQIGLMTGRPDGSFDPKGTVTRAEVAVVIERLVKMLPGA